MDHIKQVLRAIGDRFTRKHTKDVSWTGEPLDHASISAMSLREVDDLPLPAFILKSHGQGIEILRGNCSAAGHITKTDCSHFQK